jgi:predicted dehydrogenase
MATRVSPAVKKVKELIGKGFLGKPYSVTMDWVADQTRLTQPSGVYPGGEISWKYSAPAAGLCPGGKLIFHGTHYIGALLLPFCAN